METISIGTKRLGELTIPIIILAVFLHDCNILKTCPIRLKYVVEKSL